MFYFCLMVIFLNFAMVFNWEMTCVLIFKIRYKV